jgi:cytochrome c
MKAFAAKQPIWDYEHIYEFIKGPQAYVNGTKMTFVGLKQPQDRINVIAYLHGQGSTLPIPAPNPAAAAPAAAPAAPGAAPAAGAAAPTKPGDKPAAPAAAAPAADAKTPPTK